MDFVSKKHLYPEKLIQLIFSGGLFDDSRNPWNWFSSDWEKCVEIYHKRLVEFECNSLFETLIFYFKKYSPINIWWVSLCGRVYKTDVIFFYTPFMYSCYSWMLLLDVKFNFLFGTVNNFLNKYSPMNIRWITLFHIIQQAYLIFFYTRLMYAPQLTSTPGRCEIRSCPRDTK